MREIKEKEVELNTLQAELDRIQNLDISASQLQLANDSFHNFTQIWSDIVTKITDILNSPSMKGIMMEFLLKLNSLYVSVSCKQCEMYCSKRTKVI